jgi:hypothetical protein
MPDAEPFGQHALRLLEHFIPLRWLDAGDVG